MGNKELAENSLQTLSYKLIEAEKIKSNHNSILSRKIARTSQARL
jgi:hypothetical protein